MENNRNNDDNGQNFSSGIIIPKECLILIKQITGTETKLNKGKINALEAKYIEWQTVHLNIPGTLDPYSNTLSGSMIKYNWPSQTSNLTRPIKI